MVVFLQILQVLAAIILIVAIMVQTTKSESGAGGGSMGWGVIGGKSSSSFGKWGAEEQLNRITTWVAVAFMVASLLTAIAYSRMSG